MGWSEEKEGCFRERGGGGGVSDPSLSLPSSLAHIPSAVLPRAHPLRRTNQLPAPLSLTLLHRHHHPITIPIPTPPRVGPDPCFLLSRAVVRISRDRKGVGFARASARAQTLIFIVFSNHNDQRNSFADATAFMTCGCNCARIRKSLQAFVSIV